MVACAGAVWFSRRTDNAAPLFLIVSKIQKDDRYISNLEKSEHDLDRRIVPWAQTWAFEIPSRVAIFHGRLPTFGILSRAGNFPGMLSQL